MKPLRINRTNTILYCNRWEETVRFYRDVIKLPVLMEKGWFVEFQLTGSVCLSVADAARTSVPSTGGAGITLSWQVENIDAVHDRMLSEGVDVTPIKKTWGTRACFVFDPEGNRVELWS
ncbi:MAG: VOC family protein [Desulfosarcina sp.]|nr:VOC family protein [Desulfosarcina sp.]MBC2741876.1 VOC family protein [Desulfosarcina sp.]MBC2764789.1 VOC family protein [Desulfosarcina sp.]